MEEFGGFPLDPGARRDLDAEQQAERSIAKLQATLVAIAAMPSRYDLLTNALAKAMHTVASA